MRQFPDVSIRAFERADGTEWLPARLVRASDSFSIVDDRTLRILRRNLGTIINEEPRRVLLRLCRDNGLKGEDEIQKEWSHFLCSQLM